MEGEGGGKPCSLNYDMKRFDDDDEEDGEGGDDGFDNFHALAILVH